MIKRVLFLFGIIWMCSFVPVLSVSAGETGSDEEEMARQDAIRRVQEEMDYEDIDHMLEELFPEADLNFGTLVGRFMKGDTGDFGKLVLELAYRRWLYLAGTSKQNVIHLLLVAIGAAFLMNLSGLRENHQVSDACFLALYLLVVGLCMKGFLDAAGWVAAGLGRILAFMKVLYPVYFVAVTLAKGSVASLTFYHLALLLLILVETLIVEVILPMIHVCVIVRMMNSLRKEEYLLKLAELLELLIGWALKTIFGVMIGLHVIQGLIGPSIDSVKRSLVLRGMEAIPGVGDAIGGTAATAIGASILMKNSIGAAGALICCGICLAPLLQLLFVTIVYQLTAAIIQPVSDPRITGCISGVAIGVRLLLQAVFTCGMLFLLTIAIVSYTTNSI